MNSDIQELVFPHSSFSEIITFSNASPDKNGSNRLYSHGVRDPPILSLESDRPEIL